MSRLCDLCARGPARSNNRSHSMRQTPRRVFVNLQSKSIGGEKYRICTRCIRTIAKPERVKKEKVAKTA